MIEFSDQFYRVLAVSDLPTISSLSLTDQVRRAADMADGVETYLAALIEEGWLQGSVDRGPEGTVRAVYIRGVSERGRNLLTAKVARSLGPAGIAALIKLAMSSPHSLTPNAIDPGELELLRESGVVMEESPVALTRLGELLLQEEGSKWKDSSTTIIQGVSNSQIAVGDSSIVGSVSVNTSSPQDDQMLAAVEELASRVAEFALRVELKEELLADLATMRSQLSSPRPKRQVIQACAENVRAILQGAAGSAAFAGLAELLKRLM